MKPHQHTALLFLLGIFLLSAAITAHVIHAGRVAAMEAHIDQAVEMHIETARGCGAPVQPLPVGPAGPGSWTRGERR